MKSSLEKKNLLISQHKYYYYDNEKSIRFSRKINTVSTHPSKRNVGRGKDRIIPNLNFKIKKNNFSISVNKMICLFITDQV